MQHTKEKLIPYQMKKKAVFDDLYKSCAVNEKDQVSLASVLQYISKEIDSNFKNFEHIVSDLKETLNDKSVDGWLPFAEACNIFSNWMDKISHKSRSDASKPCAQTIEHPHEVMLDYTYQTTLPAVRNNCINDLNENDAIHEISCSKCEKCGKEENCCEWQKREMSREENITRCFEQKVTELQNLLRQSEDCNSVIQLENESLRQKFAVLQKKEERWIEKEEELQEREQQITSTNTLLKEQNVTAGKEIQHLKQQLHRLKNEKEKILSQNFLLEERAAEIPRIEKLLVEARLKQSQLELDIELKDAILADLEIKLDNLQQYNEVLERQIENMENRRLLDTPAQERHELSIMEELMAANISNEVSCESNNITNLEIAAESSLKAELDACWGQWPLSCEHVATQASPTICTTATQTDEILLVNEENKKHHQLKNIPLHTDKLYKCKFVHLQKSLPVSNDSAVHGYGSLNSVQNSALVTEKTLTVPLAICIAEKAYEIVSQNFAQNTLSMMEITTTYQNVLTKNDEYSNMLLFHNGCLQAPVILHLSLDKTAVSQLLRKRQYGCNGINKLFCRKKSLQFNRSVCWNKPVNVVAEQTRLPALHQYLYQYKLVHMIILVLVCYLFQTITLPLDGFMWRNPPSFWTEIYKVLSPKMELRWPNGPPSQ